MKNIAILTAVVGLGFGGAANAADLGVVQAPATYNSASQFDWTGFYAGINGGYGWADVSVAGFTLAEVEGASGGLQVGYNHDFGDFVLVLKQTRSCQASRTMVVLGTCSIISARFVLALVGPLTGSCHT